MPRIAFFPSGPSGIIEHMFVEEKTTRLIAVARDRSIEPRRQVVSRRDVFDYLTRNPGSTPDELAKGIGCDLATALTHLRRGKGVQFSSKGGRWFPVPEPSLFDVAKLIDA